MKKILLLGLFLAVFLIFPKKTFATACCSSGQYVENAAGKDCCKPGTSCFGNALNFDHNLYQCGINACDVGTQQCTTTAQTKDPTCSPKYPLTPDNCSEICCIPESSVSHGCKLKPNSFGIFTGCDWDKQNAGGWSVKNYCGSDGLWKYNPTTLKCEQLAESHWNLISTTCQGVQGFDTAIGCVPTGDLKLFLQFILKWAFFASGGIILLLIISTGYTIITSSGNPEKLQGAQENIVALFSGLALIAFSLVLLQAIGADILNLKAFIP